MQLFIRNIRGETVVVEADSRDKVELIKQQISEKEGIEPDQQLLTFSGQILQDDLHLEHYALQHGNTVHLGLRLLGGGAYDRCDPKLVQLAKSYRWEVMICRNCYAQNPLRATNCRKCRCSDLRKRKTGLSKGL